MAWRIEFTDTVVRQFEKLDKAAGQRIEKFLRDRVAVLENPCNIGEALQGERFGEFWKYRVGDYRLIARIEDVRVLILVVRIGHRRDVYR